MMKTLSAITLAAALTLAGLAASPAAAQEADTSGGFSLPVFTDAVLEDWFRGAADNEGWTAPQIQNAVIHCQNQDTLLCFVRQLETRRKLNAIVPAETLTVAAAASPAVPAAQPYQAVPRCSELTSAEQASSNCVNQ